MILVDMGAMASAVALLDDALIGFARADSLGLQPAALASSAHAHALLGHPGIADERLRTLDAVSRSSSFDADIERGRVFALAAGGREAEAVELLLAVADVQRAAGVVAEELAVLHDVVRLGRADLVVDRLVELAPSIQGPMGELAADHARAFLAADGNALADVGERLVVTGSVLMALDAFAHAEAAHATVAAKASAAAVRRRANELAHRCEGATTPAMRRIGAAAVLSKREREIAVLAAQGRTDKEIAEQLLIGVRTVESHLSHVYVKLGAAGRRDLATLLL
jgi:DNA-binding CsgD family transcriptional regulator